MSENNENKSKKSVLPWVIVGILCLALIGGGIYVYKDLNSSPSNAAAQTNGTGGTGNRAGGMRNQSPALRDAMSLLRLQQQQDDKLKLTADQKGKLIPIITDLKNTANPSAQFSQDKATAIEQVLTDDQKNFLNQRPTGQGQGNGSGNGPGNGSGNGYWSGRQGNGQGNGGQNQGGTPGQGASQGQGSGQGGNRQFNMSDLYDRVLQALQS